MEAGHLLGEAATARYAGASPRRSKADTKSMGKSAGEAHVVEAWDGNFIFLMGSGKASIKSWEMRFVTKILGVATTTPEDRIAR